MHTIFIDELVWLKRQAEQSHAETTSYEAYNFIDGLIYGYPIDPNKTRELIENLTSRSFSNEYDFTLLPYQAHLEEYEEDLHMLTANNFYKRLTKFVSIHLFDKKYSHVTKEVKVALDLLDPLHVTHPAWPTRKGKEISIDGVTDVSQMLISKCDKTAIVGKDVYISAEMHNFQKYYKSIKFFKSKKQFLLQGTGWEIGSGKSKSIPFSRALNILKNFYEAGIIQMLEKFPTGWSHRGGNMTVQTSPPNTGEMVEYSSKIRPISIGGTIQAIFWIWLQLIMVSTLVFIVFEIFVDCMLIYGWSRILLRLYRIRKFSCVKRICVQKRFRKEGDN